MHRVRAAYVKKLIEHEISDIPEDSRWKLEGLRDEWFLHFQLNCQRQKRSYRIRLGLQSYNLEPPTLNVVDAKGRPIPDRSQWPPAPFTNPVIHPIRKRPWVCLRGLEEYHTHPLHRHEPWDLHRNFQPLSVLMPMLAELIEKPAPVRVLQWIGPRRLS